MAVECGMAQMKFPAAHWTRFDASPVRAFVLFLHLGDNWQRHLETLAKRLMFCNLLGNRCVAWNFSLVALRRGFVLESDAWQTFSKRPELRVTYASLACVVLDAGKVNAPATDLFFECSHCVGLYFVSQFQ
jgi:hypothetical protein